MKRIAIVGCGAIAKTHGLAIQDLGFECAAVSSSRLEAAQTFAANYPELRADWLTADEWRPAAARAKLRELFKSPTVYPTFAAMREEAPFDAIIIATPPGSHCELVCEAAAMGTKAILCEKPMAMSEKQCRKMVEVCQQHGVRLAVYHEAMMLLRHFSEARRIIGTGQIGKVEFIRANTLCSLMDWSPYLWAGILHMLPGRKIDLIEATLDCAKKAVTFRHAQEDRATVHFVLNDDTHGVLFTGRKDFSNHGIRIDGTQGSLEISFISAPTLRVWSQGTRSWEVVTPPRACSYDDRREFLEGIVTGDPHYDTFNGASAIPSTLPIFAAWQSHLERRPIKMADAISFEIPLQHP